MNRLRPVYEQASARLDGKAGTRAQTHKHIASRTVRLLDPPVTSMRAKRLVQSALTASAFDGEVAQELREQPDVSQLSARAQNQLERVVNDADFLPVWFLQRGADLRRTVAQVQARSPAGVQMNGTGFLVGPGLLLTNAHVLDWSDIGGESLDVIVHGSTVVFDFEQRFDGSYAPMATFRLDPETLLLASPWNELDYVLVALAPRSVDGKVAVTDYGYNRLTAELGKVARGEPVFIIQHPLGKEKQVVLNENRLIERDERSTVLVYEADTNSGSSGSPVYNRQWEVVALHHAPQIARNENGEVLSIDGGVWTEAQGPDRIQFLALNEGIRISSILHDLIRVFGDYRQSNAIQAPQRLTSEGAGKLEIMLQTLGATPDALVAPVPVAEKAPAQDASPTRRYPRPD
ncbi:trypsin-like serine peptidase [Pseudoduganella umbonata]|nr:serine protease [Pseudoduganella umbonata]MBB3221683.1 endonuclease G [Pseudoduganella umbonata]